MTLLDELLQSPLLPVLVQRLNDVVVAERPRRQAFFDNLREDQKAEFINGEIFVQSPARYSHCLASEALLIMLSLYNTRHALGDVGHEKRLVRLTRNDYEPDICFWANEKSRAFTPDQMHFPAPDFVAEVLSPSTEAHDRGIKLKDYAAHAVLEYWIVDPDAQTIEQYVLRGESYAAPPTFRDGIIESVAIPGFRIPVQAVFDADVRASVITELAAAPR